jgi:hypothetical protein
VEALGHAYERMVTAMQVIASSIEDDQPLNTVERQIFKQIAESYQTELACSLESTAKLIGVLTGYSSTGKVHFLHAPKGERARMSKWMRKSPATLKDHFKSLERAWVRSNRKVCEIKPAFAQFWFYAHRRNRTMPLLDYRRTQVDTDTIARPCSTSWLV